ncbi:hypothetical protein B0H14DRAFT_2575465 [Mycena olivaceomarginata]|nr:hypothetical protein B0H14DRAFT_2575465 [Mycena olivaceomarginata]
MYNAQLNGKKSLYISMFKDNSWIEEEAWKVWKWHATACKPRDRETNGRGAWSRKVRRGQGRPHRTGATAAGSSCVCSIWDRSQRTCTEVGRRRTWGQRKGGGQQVWARRLGSNPRDRLQSTNALGQGSSGGRRTRGAWGAIQGTSCSPEIRLAHGVGGRNKRREPGQIEGQGYPDGQIDSGQARPIAGLQSTFKSCGFGTYPIECERYKLPAFIPIGPQKKHRARAGCRGPGGASVVEEERAMMEDDWQVTSVNNTPFWLKTPYTPAHAEWWTSSLKSVLVVLPPVQPLRVAQRLSL